ncbi:mannitol dehydrogenase family protein [Gilvimarinus sp. SDUM040013]|uniref:Mannitol dehydrogenase family protein n=1 Tax=Gilvimarinus gilvus TaxID=3058038 RepID=A0ABU4RYL4_9GAMM|nr:mannitol dehydrogenase family protein [Gilvimarinus sp. SDUM040013]MDO3386251.1 mannitol dehydrogenase family protein [Gilvimarinus sp. SDUM040013]MDX6849754.1 mannitol dehydrogenase family protein [Gilvimarinus sp. SDUM040013]
MQRLNNETLGQLATTASLPTYDRDAQSAGIVHLGIGAFHRAHQAWYTEALLNSGASNWQIIGASLRSPTVKNQLAEQDGLYTIVERGPQGERFQVVGAVKDVLVGPESPEALLAVMSDATTKIVSLTVTEKGYCHDPATGNLNVEHPDIVHDLANPNAPKSAIGYIVSALNARRLAGTPTFTVLSCDNLPNNGEVLERVVLQYAEKYDAELAAWIRTNTTFPCTMIDRIVPATTDADRKELEAKLGLRDEGMVLAEPFSQWVIEDKFCSERPAWEDAGALLVSDVHAFEIMKLRLLNGSHSLLAYTGYLAGFDYVSEVMNEPLLAKLCQIFMDREVGQTVQVPVGFDMEEYKVQLRERFSNPGLKHRTWQIAMDGSQKIPQRWLQTLQAQLDGNGDIELLCLALAAWIQYVSGTDEKGEAIDVQDPLAQTLKETCDANADNLDATVAAVLGVKAVFPEAIAQSAAVQGRVAYWLTEIKQGGVLAAIAKAV